jgi:hypothetical protein
MLETYDLYKEKNFETTNRFISYFQREDTYLRRFPKANDIFYFKLGSWRYFGEKRWKILVPESKGTWINWHTAWVTLSAMPRNYK